MMLCFVFFFVEFFTFRRFCNIVLLGKNGNKIVCLTFVYIEKTVYSQWFLFFLLLLLFKLFLLLLSLRFVIF